MISAYGPVFGYLGYQVHARKFFEAIDRIEPVALVPSHADPAGFAVDAQLSTMLARGGHCHRADASIAIGYGNQTHRLGGDWRIGFTVFETTRLAPDWHEGLRQLDEVWTTSTWGRDVLLLGGIARERIGVVPEGFDPDVFHPGLKSRRRRDGEEGGRGVFRFLCVGKWEVRKGQVDLLRAWARAFAPNDPVELLLLCENPFVPGFSVEKEIARLKLGPMAPVRVARPAPTDREMAQIYADADCFVLPTRGEGWGLPIMEALACGTPVISTRYSAMTDYLHDGNAYLLDPVRLVPAYDPLFFPQAGERGLWAEIDPDQLVHWLRHVVAQRAEAEACGLAGAEEMRGQWTWDHAARRASERLTQRESHLHHPRPAAPTPLNVQVPAPPDLPALTVGVADLIGLAERVGAEQGLAAAIRCYLHWLIEHDGPASQVAHFNVAHLLGQVGKVAEAEYHYRRALDENPDFLQARLNLGSMLERSGRVEQAIAEWQTALQSIDRAMPPDAALQVHALNSLGRVLEQQHRYADAESMLTRSLAVRPKQDDVLHHLIHLRQKQCEWPVYRPLPGIDVATQIAATSALAMLSASDDPALQLATARKYAEQKLRADLPPLAPPGGYRHERLRVGFLSSNLNLHAVTILTAEVYELLDRARFEVYGFCWSPEDGTPMRARIRKAMDHLVRIDAMSDEQAAQAIRAAEIDILFDLQGLTSGCRASILTHRPAPYQISWLGFPGTSAIPGVDYIVADRYLIPEESAQYYSEKPLYLADCFQSNDRQRVVGTAPTRARAGLPEDAVVYCAFGHNHKFTPEMFATWMRILARVPDSVLWLLADNPAAQVNLTQFAQAHGIDPTRLVFAPRVQPADYLARFRAADLFLDTMPFNGGTTASDVLWAGLPLVTLSGRSFASRMAGSLLHAVGLPELIATDHSSYEALAVELGLDRARLAAFRRRLEDKNRAHHPLFDTPRFVRALEDALWRLAKG